MCVAGVLGEQGGFVFQGMGRELFADGREVVELRVCTFGRRDFAVVEDGEGRDPGEDEDIGFFG